jgi:antirestriction protein
MREDREMMTDTTNPRIYVASLSDYNAGRLHGRWVDATQDADAIQEEVSEMLAESTEGIAEEWAIHDYEGFGDIRLSEYESFEDVSALALAIEENGEAYAAYYDYVGGSGYATPEGFRDAYCGEWDSEEDYAENLAEELDMVPDEYRWPTSYIDWERAARDLFTSDYYSVNTKHGSVYVFNANA